MTTATAPFTYTDTVWPIPERIRAAHIRSWKMLASPGEWWTGAERVSIAAECRRASAIMDDLPDPGAGPAELPEAAVHAVRKLIGDLPNVSREWFDETTSAPGMSDARYIELLGTLVAIWSVDEVHRALGLPLEPLPEPQPGAPGGYRPAGLAQRGSWPMTLAAGELAESEADIFYGFPRAANVWAAMSLHPDSVRWLNDLFHAHYLSWHEISDLETEHRTLSRAQLEIMAARVSALNECFY